MACDTVSQTLTAGAGCASCGGATAGESGVQTFNFGPAATFAFGTSDSRTTEKQQVGRFTMMYDQPNSNLFSPRVLGYPPGSNGVETIYTTNFPTYIRQVKAVDGLADVVVVSTNQYEVRTYNPTNVLSKDASGLWQVTNSPMRTVCFQKANPTNNCELYVIVNESGASLTNHYCWIETNQAWTLTRPNGLSQHSTTCVITNDGTYRTDTHQICATNTGAVSLKAVAKYTNFAWGTELVEGLLKPASGDRCAAYEYYTSTNDYGYSRLKKVTYPGGGWAYHTYDSTGRPKELYASFKNQAYTTDSNLCRYTWYDYAMLSGSGDAGADTNKLRTKIGYVVGKEVSRSYWVYLADGKKEIQCTTAGAAWDDASNLVTTTRYYTNGSFNGWLASVLQPDGTFTLHEYATNSTSRTNIVWHGQPNTNYTAVIAGTKTVSVLSTNGQTLSSSRYDVNSTILTGQQTYSNFDQWNRPGRVTHLDATYEDTVYGCCGPDSVTDREGTTTTYGYDSLKRVTSESRNGISRLLTYDASSQTTRIQRQGTNGTTVTLSLTAYDQAGRIVHQTNALGGVTSFAYGTNSSGQLTTTVTNADGGTRIDLFYADGQRAKLTGSAAHPVRYDYGVEQDGSVWRFYRKEIKLDADGNDAGEWTKNYTDMADRNYKTVFAGSGTPYRQSFYNNKGQLWKDRDPDGVVMLYTNNALGEPAYTAIDSNRNDVIDFSGLDRITQTTNDVLANYSTNVMRTRTYVWETSGSSASTLLSSRETSVEGLRTWTTVYRDASTPVTSTNWTVFAGSGNRYETNRAPDGSSTVSHYQYGRLQSVTRKDNVGAQISQTTYQYDAHGRTLKVIDARNGANAYGYNDADLVVSMITPAPGNGQSPQTTLTYYNTMLQATNVVQPDGGSVTNEFYPNGLLKKSSGSRTYPVAYSYDAQGRLKTMTNWSGYPSIGARVMTSNYETNRGWLQNKRYPDGLGPDYTYTSAGKLATRTWGRGVAVTNFYNDAGELASVNYSDNTPAVTTVYDRRSRPSAITQGTNTWRVFYNLAGQLLSEVGTAGILNGLAVTNTYDAWMRRTTLETKNSGSQLTSQSYAYNGASRLTNVTDGYYSAAYTYLANSPLVSQITFRSNTVTRMTSTKQYDYLNRLSSISSVGGASSASPVSFSYLQNDANQRTRSDLGDGSYWLYEYDSLGQVKSGKRYWSDGTPVAGQQFEYAFDDIGNRTSTKAGGDAGGAALRVAAYTNNTLNQITGRDVPGAVDIIGAATATATNVNVNDQAAYRRGEYYWKELSINNASAAVWQGVTNRAVQSGTTNTVTGNVFLPKTPEALSYDADGNLTNDGRWVLTWDAENRLTQVESLASAPAASKRKVVWEYDHRGRRVRQKVFDGSSGSYVIGTDLKFLHDGWHCVAELNATNNALLRNYLWGLDLSRTMEGAGGIGGLLAINSVANGVHFAAYDGNGNVTALVKGTDGTASSNYEFDPFGQTVRATGAMAKENPYRFSTKRTDEASDFVHYEYRAYNPSAGQWLSRDPINEPALVAFLGTTWRIHVDEEEHLYRFVKNNAIGLRDSFGLCAPCDPGWLTSGIGGFLASDVNYGARVVYAEATCGSGVSEDQLAVASVLRNRIRATGISGGIQTTFRGVANAPNQFESVGNNTSKFRESAPGTALLEAKCRCLETAIQRMRIAAAWGSPDFLGPIYGYDEFRAAVPPIPAGWTVHGGNRFRNNPGIGQPEFQ